MGKFFNSENWLWRGFGRVADFFLLSCCWFLCSLPLVTVSSASIALYDAIARCVYGSEEKPYRRFFRTFKRELKQGIGITVLWVILAAVLGAGYQILYQQAQADANVSMLTIVYYFSLFIPVAIFCWLLAVESRFVYGFGQLHKMAAYFTFAHLPTTVAIVIPALITFELCVNLPFLMMVLPGICAYIQAIFIERVFQKYISKDEKEGET